MQISVCMKHFVYILFLVVCLVSCNGHSKHWEVLTQVESYIEERPDTALVTLEQIDLSELSGREGKIRFTILHGVRQKLY